MAGSQIPTSVTILNSLHGFMGLSLKEYSTSAAASIASGSVVEIAGAFFTFIGDEVINASSWTAITTGTTAYITLTPSGTAGSQIVTAEYTATTPVWRDDFQGWYASAASTVRIIGSVYKAEATNYGPKYLYSGYQDNKIKSITASTISASNVIASSISIGSIAVTPFRLTTQSFVKTSYTTDSVTTLTSISVYATLDGYCVASTAPTVPFLCYSFVSANTIYTSTAIGVTSVTNMTFYIKYLY